MDEPRSIYPVPEAPSDIWLYRLLIGGLVVAILLIIISAFVLSMFGRPINEAVVAIGAAAVGFLGGVLTPAPKQGA